VVDVTFPMVLPAWAAPIDVGEIAAILLAQQQPADSILIDNAHARRAARSIGLPLIGTIGVLLHSFRQGFLSLPEFELLIQRIQHQPDLWISDELCDRALAQARREARQP
jgi:hypothetical protein